MSERWDLRLGRWEDVLADVECDVLICDPPYSERTHDGHFAGCSDKKDAWAARTGRDDKRRRRRAITYASWTADDVARFVASWSPRTRGWMVCLTSHDLCEAYSSAFAAAGRYCFAPLPFVEPGKCPRLSGDGPASWTCWIMVARPSSREYQRWGSLDGAYVFPKGTVEQIRGVVGGKPVALMRAIVRDYSRPGDLICDPTAGLATTGVAALTMGRRFVGSECDPETYEKGRKRLSETQVVDLFDSGRATQESLL